METDYQKMFDNLAILLQDICQFLTSDRLGFLSHRDKKLMECLINRSKVQLQEIAKVEKFSAIEEYVDMDAKKVIEEEEGKLDIYSSVDDVNRNDEIMIQEEILSPYVDLPAKEASQQVKYGYMSMRRKFLLGFEKMKRVYGTIHNQWLLIYVTDKDTKPISTFNLKHYEAKEPDGPKSCNFELISTSSVPKTYYFMALTPKDMLQWVVNINRCHDNVIVKSKGLDFEENIELEHDIEEHYDAIMPNQQNEEIEEEEEDIYIELNDIDKPSQNNNTIHGKEREINFTYGPPLPGRRPQQGLIPILPSTVKPPTPLHGSEESLASYDDIKELQKGSEASIGDTFSDDDGDNTYEEFVHVKQDIIKRSHQLAPEDTNRVNESDQLKTNAITILKDETSDSKFKNQPVVSINDRIGKYQMWGSSTVEKDANSDADKRDGFNDGRNRSFVHDTVARKSTPPHNLSLGEEVKNGVIEIKNKSSSPTISPSSQNLKKFGALSPPILPKVPVVPLKPKARDGQPSTINKRSPFATFRQTATDH